MARSMRFLYHMKRATENDLCLFYIMLCKVILPMCNTKKNHKDYITLQTSGVMS